MRARAIAVAGHVAVLASLALPWVGGEFGSRETLSAFHLPVMLEQVLPSLPTWEVSLGWVVPLAAVQAALTWPMGTLLRLEARWLRAIEFVLSAAVAAAALAVGAGAVLAAQTGGLVDGPRAGTLLALLGSFLVLVARPGMGPDARSITNREARVIRGRILR
jgi:hypothetical protein